MKKILALALVLVLALSAIACGSNNANNDAVSSDDASVSSEAVSSDETSGSSEEVKVLKMATNAEFPPYARPQFPAEAGYARSNRG